MSDKFSKLDPPEPPFFMKLILSVVLFVLCGVAIMLMWNWFVVALGLPSIGLAHAMGIDLPHIIYCYNKNLNGCRPVFTSLGCRYALCLHCCCCWSSWFHLPNNI